MSTCTFSREFHTRTLTITDTVSRFSSRFISVSDTDKVFIAHDSGIDTLTKNTNLVRYWAMESCKVLNPNVSPEQLAILFEQFTASGGLDQMLKLEYLPDPKAKAFEWS